MRALERDPANRYQSARELRTELMAWLAETGQSHDKRRIAEYLRSIFELKKLRDADEFTGGERDDDEELHLEKALPQQPESALLVDAEDPPDEVHLVAPPASGEVRPIMDAATAPIDTDTTAPKQRIDGEEADRLPEPPTVPLHADETPKRVILPQWTQPRRPWWKRLFGLFVRR
jgi:hypothetical protein